MKIYKNPFFYFSLFLTGLLIWQVALIVQAQYNPPPGPPPQMTGIGGFGFWQASSNNGIYYNAGNVGIGTTDPGNKLHIKDGSVLIDSSVPRIIFKASDTDMGSIYLSTNKKLYAQNPGSAPFEIGAGGGGGVWQLVNNTGPDIYYMTGNVGIGVDQPTKKFEVATSNNLYKRETYPVFGPHKPPRCGCDTQNDVPDCPDVWATTFSYPEGVCYDWFTVSVGVNVPVSYKYVLRDKSLLSVDESKRVVSVGTYLGIGTSTPSTHLEVIGNARVTGMANLESIISGSVISGNVFINPTKITSNSTSYYYERVGWVSGWQDPRLPCDTLSIRYECPNTYTFDGINNDSPQFMYDQGRVVSSCDEGGSCSDVDGSFSYVKKQILNNTTNYVGGALSLIGGKIRIAPHINTGTPIISIDDADIKVKSAQAYVITGGCLFPSSAPNQPISFGNMRTCSAGLAKCPDGFSLRGKMDPPTNTWVFCTYP